MFYETAQKVFNDERLENINPASYATYEEYVLDILLAGSTLQRAALLDLIPKDCDLSMPEIKTLGRKPAIELLTTYVVQTCKMLGCDFEGDRTTVITLLFDEYGGLSVLEWARFFYRIQKLQYNSQYQSVNTRGLNAEFLNDWIRQYCEDRDDIILRLRKEMPAVPERSESSLPYETIKKMQAEAADINAQVHHWWTEYENRLTERTMETLVTTEIIDGKQVAQQHHVPLVKDKPIAAYTRLRDLLQVFYCLNGEDASQVIVEIMAGWEIERASFFSDTAPQDFYRARAKEMYKALRRFIRPEIYHLIIRDGMSKIAADYPLLADFYKALTGIDYTGDRPVLSIINHIDSFTERIAKEFHSNYFKDAKLRLQTPDAFPLTRTEFVFLSAVKWSISKTNSPHPFTSILNFQQ